MQPGPGCRDQGAACNRFNSTFDGLAHREETPITQEAAKADAAAFIESLGLGPLDVGGLEMARGLQGVGPLMGLARNGAGTFDVTLGVTPPG